MLEPIRQAANFLVSPWKRKDRGVFAAAGGSSAGVAVTRDAAMEVSSVMASVSCIAQDIGQIPLELWEERVVGDRRMQYRAAWAREYTLFTRGPNSYQTPQQWIEQILYHCLIFGKYFANKTYVGGFVDELHPFDDPSRVKVSREDGRLQYELLDGDAGLYAGRYTDEQVLYIPGPSPDGYLGRDIATSLRQPLGIALALSLHANTFFSKGGYPSVILILPEGTKEADRKIAKEKFEELYNGSGRSHVAVYSRGTELTRLESDPQKAQALESRQQNASDIASSMRVPEWRIRQQTPPSHQAWRDYIAITLGPWMERVRAGLEKHILGGVGGGPSSPRLYLAWDQERLLELDFPSQVAAYRQAIDGRILNPNEVRERLGFNPYAEGGAYVNPHTTAFADPATQGGE